MILMLHFRLLRPIATALCSLVVFAFAGAQVDPEGEKLLRLSMIAGSLQSGDNTESLIKEAAHLCGFAVWKDDPRSTVSLAADPSAANHLAVTESEITNYAKMFDNGQWANLVDLAKSVDGELKRLGYPGSCKPYLYKWLNEGDFSDNASTRLIVSFIHDLSVYHKNHTDATFGDDAQIDSVQTLFVLRVLTEDAEVPIRKQLLASLAPSATLPLFATTQPAVPQQSNGSHGALPTGPAEDAYAGLLGGFYGSIADYIKSSEGAGFIQNQIRNLGSGMSAMAQIAAVINPLSTVTKFLSTYAFLGGDVAVEDPDKTLVRMKSDNPDDVTTAPGNTKTLVCLFKSDSTKFHEWFANYRQQFLLVGLDLDEPRASALSGVETNWELTLPYGDIVQWSAGQPQPDRQVTDSNGYARRKIEGTPQKKLIHDDLATPVERSFTVKVTPQIKASSATQDAVDAMGSVLPFKDAQNVGGQAHTWATSWITPVYEMLYRMKWQCTVKRNVGVKDFVEAPIVGDVNFQATGQGSGHTQTSKMHSIVTNFYRAYGVPMKLKDANDPLSQLPPGALDKIPAAARDIVLQQLKAQAQATRTASQGPPTYTSDKDGNCEFLALARFDTDYTDPNESSTYEKNYWNASGWMDIPSRIPFQNSNFEILLDTNRQVAHIDLPATKLGKETHKRDGAAAIDLDNESSPVPVLVLVDINVAHQNWDIPYTLTESHGVKTFKGNKTMPFSMLNGQKFGTVVISFSLTFKPTTAK